MFKLNHFKNMLINNTNILEYQKLNYFIIILFTIFFFFSLFLFVNKIFIAHITIFLFFLIFLLTFTVINTNYRSYLNVNYNFFKLNDFFMYDYNILILSFMIISILVTPICIDYSNKKNNKIFLNNLILYWVFNFIIYIFVFSKNILTFFFSYELMLLISFFLVYLTGQNKRSILTSIYFLLWTQFGSFIIFLSIIIIIANSNNLYFSNFINFSFYYSALIATFFFIGFGIKIPVWPFNFWLTKTHVEANTGFSIFLSGILVKTAVVGLYKVFFFFNKFNLIFFIWFFVVSLYDVALKILSQIDLKKIVAYATIFEMNMLIFFLFTFSKKNYIFLIFFFLFHSVISSVFFLIIDFLYKIYNTRITNGINNILKKNDKFGIIIIFFLILITGFPMTLKFILEFILFGKLLFLDIIIFILVSFSVYIFNITFLLRFFKIFFGNIKGKNINYGNNKKDIVILIYLFTILILIPFII